MIINITNIAAIAASISMAVKYFNKMKSDQKTKNKILYLINIILSVGVVVANFKLLADRNFLPEEDEEE